MKSTSGIKIILMSVIVAAALAIPAVAQTGGTYSTATGEAAGAANLSGRGRTTVHRNTEEGASAAQSAFDGSTTDSAGAAIKNTNVRGNSYPALALKNPELFKDLKKLDKLGEDVEESVETKKELQNNIWESLLIATMATFASMAVILTLRAIPAWGTVAAAAVTALMIVYLLSLGGHIIETISKINQLKYAGGSMNTGVFGALAFVWLAYLFTRLVSAWTLPPGAGWIRPALSLVGIFGLIKALAFSGKSSAGKPSAGKSVKAEPLRSSAEN